MLKLILGGGMVEYHGKFYDFDKLRMSPAPSEPVPFYVGGHTEAALRRAARVGDGWTSAMIKFDELRDVIDQLGKLRAEYDRSGPFEIQAVCVNRFGVDGYRQQAEIGVTDAIVVPWVFYGVGLDGPLAGQEGRHEAVRRRDHGEAMTAVTWSGPETTHPARTASRRSMDAVCRGAKEEWLALFAEDGVVEDPVGVSMFDPTGDGHRGRDAIAAFWDMTIANVERFEFDIKDSFAAGDEVANVGTISAFLPGGSRVDTEGVFVYRVNEDGLDRVDAGVLGDRARDGYPSSGLSSIPYSAQAFTTSSCAKSARTRKSASAASSLNTVSAKCAESNALRRSSFGAPARIRDRSSIVASATVGELGGRGRVVAGRGVERA